MTGIRVGPTTMGLAIVASVSLTAGALAEGGNDIFTAVNIGGIPFSDTGYTCDNTDDGDAICPYSGSTSPDVWYYWIPDMDIPVHVDLCASDSYDTKTYILDENLIEIACNDDACGLNGWRSEILCADLFAGVQYFFSMDGYGGACGTYILYIEECIPCVVECGPYDLLEGEPPCEDNYVDNWNGGCNSTPYVFQDFPCSNESFFVCGATGTYLYGTSNYRDTDWFQTTTDEQTNLILTGQCECPVQLLIIEGLAGDCVTYNIPGVATGGPCTDVTASVIGGAPGLWWFWVGPSVFSDWPCDQVYYMDMRCEAPEPCDVVCPEGGWLELEPVCGPMYDDHYNGGCNSTPYIFQAIGCGQTVCGETGTFDYAGLNYRDTDWFELYHPGGDLTWTGQAECPFLIFVIDAGTYNCVDYTIIDSAVADPCVDATITVPGAPAGGYWLWAGPSVFSGWPCPVEYYGTVICDNEGPHLNRFGGVFSPQGYPIEGTPFWWLYPEWWNVWFYDDPIDWGNAKFIHIEFVAEPLDPGYPGFLRFAVNWSSLYWSEVMNPWPEPRMLPTPPFDEFVMRHMLFEGPIAFPEEFMFDFEIIGYNPEWVSVDVWAENVIIRGWIWHECVWVSACPWDLNGDLVVDVLDLLQLLACWGQPCGDVNGDGTTDVMDLLELLAHWGPCP